MDLLYTLAMIPFAVLGVVLVFVATISIFAVVVGLVSMLYFEVVVPETKNILTKVQGCFMRLKSRFLT